MNSNDEVHLGYLFPDAGTVLEWNTSDPGTDIHGNAGQGWEATPYKEERRNNKRRLLDQSDESHWEQQPANYNPGQQFATFIGFPKYGVKS